MTRKLRKELNRLSTLNRPEYFGHRVSQLQSLLTKDVTDVQEAEPQIPETQLITETVKTIRKEKRKVPIGKAVRKKKAL